MYGIVVETSAPSFDGGVRHWSSLISSLPEALAVDEAAGVVEAGVVDAVGRVEATGEEDAGAVVAPILVLVEAGLLTLS